MTVDDAALAAALGRVPWLAGAPAHDARRLAGMTNRNYLVEHRGGRYVVRLPGAGTAEYIDRRQEEVAARSASAAGVNVELLHFDPADGLMVTRFVDGAATMDPDRFADLDAVGRAARAFHRLHTTATPFADDFVLFPMIGGYKELLASKGARLPDGYDEVQARASVVQVVMEARPVPLVPSHCDPLCENFLDAGERMYLINYEYSGNNDPMWDLGDLSVEGAFSEAQDRALLAAYFDGAVPPEQNARMVVYKAMCDLLWTLWGVIQHVNGNPVDDFWAYAVRRFERCQALMATPAFAEHVEVLRCP